MELATIESARRRERRGTATIPQRLRSALTARGWVKRPEPRVRFGQPVLPGLATLSPSERAAASSFVARAQALRAGRLAHLGATVAMDGAIDWFPRDASPAWLAALHGLDELVAAGVAAVTAADPDERRAWYELAIDVHRDWTRAVPPGHPVAWSLPALARRVRNLLLVQALFVTELRKDVEARRELLAHLYDQAGALAEGLASRTPDPWLIAGANALFLAGRFFDGMEARSWVEAGTTALWAQLREQVLEDGGHASRSPVWQAFVLAEYLVTLAALRADNDDVPIWGRKRVKGMADCLARLAHPDGTLTAFDPWAVDDVWPVEELLAGAAIVLHEPAFAVAPTLPGIWPILLAGDAGRRAYAGFSHTPPPVQARVLRRTGFYVLAGEAGDAMIVDGAARPGGGGVAAFGFEASVGGLPLVVAPPVGAEAPGVVAAHARSVRSRNVVVANAGMGNAGATDCRFTVRDGAQYFVGSVAGFLGRGPDASYRRRIFCVPGRFWLVADEILGEGTFSGESLLHLHPEARVRAECAGRPVLRVERSAQSAMTVVAAGVRSLGLAGGTSQPGPQGWYPDDAGGWRPAPVVIVRLAGTLPIVAGYLLVPRALDDAPEVSLASDAFELRATVRLGDVVHQLTAVQDEVSLVTGSA